MEDKLRRRERQSPRGARDTRTPGCFDIKLFGLFFSRVQGLYLLSRIGLATLSTTYEKKLSRDSCYLSVPFFRADIEELRGVHASNKYSIPIGFISV